MKYIFVMRRFFVALCILVCPFASFAEGSPEQMLHLANRITYGPSPYTMAEIKRLGLQGFIEQQLHPERIADTPGLLEVLGKVTTLNMSLYELCDHYLPQKPANGVKPDPEQQKAMRKAAGAIADNMREARLLRAIYSQAQLQELMVDFWFNHFNVFEDKEQVRVLIGTYERDAIRAHAMGKFRDLLEATAHHPAMLVYLDNRLNTAPGSKGAHGKLKGLNENYAREIMELHTMGVNGGYTQADVTTLARILTGLGVGYGKGKDKAEKFSEVEFDPYRHDFGTKVFLGHTIYGSGEPEIETALDIIAQHPSTAHYISYKIAQYFVDDTPPDRLVQAMADTFIRTDGDIRSVLSTMLYSREFWDRRYMGRKFKPPLRYAVSAVRISGVPVHDLGVLHQRIQQMGEPLYHCLTPDGYADTTDLWLNSDALMRRIDFARFIIHNPFIRREDTSIKNVKTPDVSVNAMAQTIGYQITPSTRNAINNAADSKMRPALFLASPEFLYY